MGWCLKYDFHLYYTWFNQKILASFGAYHALDCFLETLVNQNYRLLQTNDTGWALSPAPKHLKQS